MKRLFDIVAAGLGLLLLSPALLFIGLLVRITMGKPVLFRQMRPGLDGRPFELIKFRTMRIAHSSESNIGSDAARMTKFGRLLRSTSMDELPELWNILRGDMSMVGPRPLLMSYLSRYNPEQARRHQVRPGLTGWAQVNGRNALTWHKKFELDTWYVDNRSFRLDLKILVLTILHVLRRQGISADGEATMPEFLGAEEPLEAAPPLGSYQDDKP